LKRKYCVILLAVAMVFMVILACGKKGPPFIPKKQVPHRVKELKGQWIKDKALLEGKVSKPAKSDSHDQEIIGCKVYYAWYSKNSAPCEDCPIDLRELKTIEGDVVKGRRFKCTVPDIRKKGIHFFRVRLLRDDGESGSFSNRVKLVSE